MNDCDCFELHEYRLNTMESRLTRLEKFILTALIMVALTTISTFWNTFLQPQRVYAEMIGSLRSEIIEAIREANRSK